MEHVDEFVVFESLGKRLQPLREVEPAKAVYPERISMYMVTTVIDYQRCTPEARGFRLGEQQFSDLVCNSKRGGRDFYACPDWEVLEPGRSKAKERRRRARLGSD